MWLIPTKPNHPWPLPLVSVCEFVVKVLDDTEKDPTGPLLLLWERLGLFASGLAGWLAG